jgi:hypothetical protein
MRRLVVIEYVSVDGVIQALAIPARTVRAGPSTGLDGPRRPARCGWQHGSHVPWRASHRNLGTVALGQSAAC